MVYIGRVVVCCAYKVQLRTICNTGGDELSESLIFKSSDREIVELPYVIIMDHSLRCTVYC